MMPTLQTDTRTATKLPDIFRTINGLNLDVGPLDRLRDGLSTTDNVSASWNISGRGNTRATHARGGTGATAGSGCPRIILRDGLGHELDTFTTLQEAIYRAKQNVKQSGQSKMPLEWRLPKAPPPARPDFTRTCPPPHHPPVPNNDAMKQRNNWNHTRVLEFDVEDVGFVQESLQYLPYAPSLSFLRQEILVGPKTYFQIVGTILLHRRILSQTEKRQAVYNFPGLCSGCTRMGLCYGCEKSSELHFHEDRPVKTGGGFTYFKKDRPENEIKRRNPAYWKVQRPEQALKKLMEEYAGIQLEGHVPDEVKKHLETQDKDKQDDKPYSNIPDFAAESKSSDDGKGLLPDINMNNGVTSGDDLNLEGHTTDEGQGLDSKDVSIEMAEDDTDFYKNGGEDADDDMIARQQDTEEDSLEDVDVVADANALEDDDTSGHEADTSYDSQQSHARRMSGAPVTDALLVPGDEDLNTQGQTDAQLHGDVDVKTSEGEDGKRGRRKLRFYRGPTTETPPQTAPPPFKLKKSPRRKIDAKLPFSTDRAYNIPKGKGIDIKKSDRPSTEFKEFGNNDGAWKEPKKFELQKTDPKATQFWSGPPKSEITPPVVKKREKKSRSRSPKPRRRAQSPRAVSPDSGLDSAFLTDSTNRSELEPVREETLTITPEPGMDRGGTPLQHRVKSPDKCRTETPPAPPKKREIVKKEKKIRLPITEPQPQPLPPPPPPRVKSRSSTRSDSPSSRELSFIFIRDSSAELPPIEVPALPEVSEKEKYESKLVKKEKKLIEVTPSLAELKKKLPPPPKLAPRIKTRASRKDKVAEAPVTSEELQQLSDPLDFLAKFCIINPDRLPFYERIFNGTVDYQSPRYTRDQHHPTKGGMVHFPPAKLSDHELGMIKDMTVITHAQSPRREGMSVPEQYLEKLNYSIEFIKMKQDTVQDHMQKLQGEKIHLMAQLARGLDRDIGRVDYKTKQPKKKKKKKSKKKSKTPDPDYDMMGSIGVWKDFQPTRASDITDEVIVSRMDEKMMKTVKKDPVVSSLSMEISRDIEKLKSYDQRMMQIEDDKDLVGLYCMDHYFNEQNESSPPYAFRRQQSRLYQKLHPDPDIQMNLDEVPNALQQINNKLLTEKEFQYIYFILDLPKREKINFRLFSIIAALSEKVTQMDPVIRKLINKVDYNALDVKMEKSKELFELLQDESLMPVGNAPADILAVELTAGGLTPEHTRYVLSKFNREGRGFIDFLDFVTYVPLFIQIHKRIVEDPFNDSLTV